MRINFKTPSTEPLLWRNAIAAVVAVAAVLGLTLPAGTAAAVFVACQAVATLLSRGKVTPVGVVQTVEAVAKDVAPLLHADPVPVPVAATVTPADQIVVAPPAAEVSA